MTVPFDRCDLLTHGECFCPTRCAAQPEPVTAPVNMFSPKEIAVVSALFGILIACFAVTVSIPRLIHADRIATLECQEACVSWAK